MKEETIKLLEELSGMELSQNEIDVIDKRLENSEIEDFQKQLEVIHKHKKVSKAFAVLLRSLIIVASKKSRSKSEEEEEEEQKNSMENTYRIEIGIQKSSGHITLREKVELKESMMKDLLDVLTVRKPMTITNAIKVLDLAEDSRIDYFEIKEG